MTSEGTDTSRNGTDASGLWADVEYGEDPRAWAHAVRADFPDDGDILCDPRVFVPLDDWVDVSVGVLCFDPDLAATALATAGERLMSVNVRGEEVDLDEVVDDDEEDYTPNYIHDVERRGDTVGYWIDTKGERYTWMFRTFLRIVAEELRAVGAVPAKIVPFADRTLPYPSDAELA